MGGSTFVPQVAAAPSAGGRKSRPPAVQAVLAVGRGDYEKRTRSPRGPGKSLSKATGRSSCIMVLPIITTCLRVEPRGSDLLTSMLGLHDDLGKWRRLMLRRRRPAQRGRQRASYESNVIAFQK